MKKPLALCLLALLLVLGLTPRLRADESKPILNKEDKLTEEDPKDRVVRSSYAKSYTVKFEAGKAYRIDMTSREVDSFLRLEDPNGKQVATDDDGGGYPNARIVHKATQGGEYKIIATTFGQPMGQFKLTGAFTLNVSPAGPVDLLEVRAKEILRASPAERNATINDVKKHLEENGAKIGQRDLVIAMTLASGLERAAPKQAVGAYRDFGKILAASSDANVASQGRMLEGCARRLALPGNPIEIKGTTLDGKEIDLAKLKGKVVLVDFWATWCGPCIGEIPNMKKAYEAYHDRGFEILGVSVDQDKEKPTKFVEARKLPWPCIHDNREGGKSYSEHYGVMFIPLPILVDRDGKVVSMTARGPELDRLLEKHIGPAEPEKK
jgi:thiol-disulfide isomerase/thioredoxin